MPRFEPFAGLRYASDHDLSVVSAPPYDVIDDEQREVLAAADHNAVHVDLPKSTETEDQYAHACRLLGEWQADGTLVTDPSPTFTVYRMGFTDEAGVTRHTTGVIGALTLATADEGEVLPHEQTTKKAKSDRLDMLRYCRHNLSAIWGLSLSSGLTDLLPLDREPDHDWVDPDGVSHTTWTISNPDLLTAIADRVAQTPIVIADGHHRYATSLAYRDERRAVDGMGSAADATLAYVVELVEEELTIQPIHRLLTGLAGVDVVAALSSHFDVDPTDPFDPDAVARLVEVGALGLVTADGTFLLRPKPDAFDDGVELDTVRLEIARASLPDHEIRYQHGVANVTRAIAQGTADVAVLGRPATIEQINAIAHGGDRMPPKTTFFAPKPATGIVFRSLDD